MRIEDPATGERRRIRVALVGLGKMGLSHLAIISTHPDVDLVAICDSTAYVLDVLQKYTGVKGYADYRKLLSEEQPDAVVIATPTRFHSEIVQAALERNAHVYCEKPFCLDPAEGLRLAQLAESKSLINQVGYHYRFVAAFQEMKRLLDAGVLEGIHHFRAEAYGPVVLRPNGSTWRTSRVEGGGCLYDYACHAIDLVHYLVGPPDAVGGTVLNRVFSRNVEDGVYSTFLYADGKTGQLAANWSDESFRKMSVKVTAWGSNGSICADRQEIQVYLRESVPQAPDLVPGWNVRYTTQLTRSVWFYLRGEEYSAQLDHFIQSVKQRSADTLCTFRAAAAVDLVAAMMLKDAQRKPLDAAPLPARKEPQFKTAGLINAAREFLR
jgi:scyllo-inositol 2-dehydrogenase (NADP+)